MKTVEDHKLEMEEEANLFARCLLMPERMIRAEVKRIVDADEVGDMMDDGNPCIAKLAKLFGVSVVVMTLRLQELGLLKP